MKLDSNTSDVLYTGYLNLLKALANSSHGGVISRQLPDSTNSTLPDGPLGQGSSDHHGEMLFIVATLCVYSLGIVAFIGGHIYKRTESQLQDVQATEYLSSHIGLERLKRKEKVAQALLQCGVTEGDCIIVADIQNQNDTETCCKDCSQL